MANNITPALNAQVTNRAIEIAKQKGLNKSQKEFNKAFNEAIKEYGYSPAYYHKVMREIGGNNE